MIRCNGRILAASATTLLLLGTACAPADSAPDSDAALEGVGSTSPDVVEEGPIPVDASALIDPNTAEEVALAGAGLDRAAVDAVLAARPFGDMTELDALLAESMDRAAREDLYARVWIPLDLNSASREEILLIPGVGDRMAHEFEEYRPYRAIEEFRREIGKYVDDAEVERLERYVTVR